MANPWIFRQIEDVMHGREPFQPTLEDKRALLLEYFEMLQQDMPKLPAIGRMKQLAGQFTRGLQGGALFRTALYHSHSVEEILDRISEYFEMLQQDMPKLAAIGRMKQLAGQFTRGLQGGALFRTALYHSHTVEEILDRISEYFETITADRQYFGETGPPRELVEAPVLDSCEAASV